MSIEAKPTRERILDAALDLLTAGQGVRMGDVAKQAGISRQALYLHFGTRTELLVATTLHLDQIKGRDARLAPVRAAETGLERLRLWVQAWCAFVPEIHGLARALMDQSVTDAEAALAWAARMEDMRQGCQAALAMLARDGSLRAGMPVDQATDLLWMLLSVQNWEALVQVRGWSQVDYAQQMERQALEMLTGRVGNP
ncbi:TetR/AcrR family transcriptional regulator [Neogemmobacter tilapiae]|uniref:HTH tetR-type domain-containing protein n=1 Tax=Neogemmobacter tilapiae TaxID=875041 RepID=A0A918WK03_9RHOB|nr:TetR/AcrR family transcriptional regulator [Gemmobacter tilapiae]GHC52873.1 hypothetical protein GCM10007315_14320 [Gemmobacter tilapiae]